ncbi:hypothetical protein H6F42_18210 [Pseudanabaena sp. FACHB-1998]|uniref:hypothetical protein n=1 Tax=Pseudanabaena sp. FACHB-1998 TaxID=2692858 RepID=UPI001680A7A4|nr:hypothetical protein [Pseudanabaena sp. FACHB-1998]MBD2178858.1 hypothetical protein [Pseudanabaena sp. FACHB-1998]
MTLPWGFLAFIPPTQAAGESITLNNISRPVLECIKRDNKHAKGEMYYTGGDNGEGTIRYDFNVLGKIRYNFEVTQSKLTVQLTKGSHWTEVSNGYIETAEKCRQNPDYKK